MLGSAGHGSETGSRTGSVSQDRETPGRASEPPGAHSDPPARSCKHRNRET